MSERTEIQTKTLVRQLARERIAAERVQSGGGQVPDKDWWSAQGRLETVQRIASTFGLSVAVMFAVDDLREEEGE